MNTLATTEALAGVGGRPTAVCRRIGDLTIGFRAGLPGPGRRSAAAWTKLAAAPQWQLWQQVSGSSWKGFPLTEIMEAGWHVWLLGEVYGQHGSAEAREQQLMRIIRGERGAAELNGHLLLCAWEEGRRQWHLWTNRFGTLHCYHARSGEVAALGTSFAAVAQLASRRTLDWAALTGFFGFGFFPEDRTFHDDVRILRPATHYVFSASGEELSARRYWEWQHLPDSKRSQEDTVAEFAGVFAGVMSDLLRNGCQTADAGAKSGLRVAIPISGGLDSRSTVAALRRATQLPTQLWSYSYGYADDSVETRIAWQVAATCELPFVPFTIEPYLFDELDRILGAVEGFQDLTQCRQAFAVDELRRRADYVIAAHWGDVWLDEMGLVSVKQHAERGKRKADELRLLTGDLVMAHTLGKMTKRGRAWLFQNLCAQHLGQQTPESLLPQFVNAGLERLQHIEDPDFRVKAFKTDNWSFRWTLASLRMFQAAAFPRLPFYDTRLADFFATVPSAFVSGRQLQIDYLKRFAPELARIEWQAKGADLYHCQRPDAWQLPKRAVNKAVRLMTGKKIIERNWEIQFGGRQGQAGLEHWLLRRGLRLHDLLPKAKVKGLLDDFRAKPLEEGRGYTVCMLLTFSAWLEAEGN